MNKVLYAVMMFGLALGTTGTVGCTLDSATVRDGSDVDVSEATSALSSTDLLSQVAVRFTTGGDDKRSDSGVFYHVTANGFDNLFSAGGTGATWGNNTSTGFFISNLPPSTHNGDISNFFVTWQQGQGGFIQTGDAWNLQQVEVYVFDTAISAWVLKAFPSGDPLQRFTGTETVWSLGGWPQ